MLARQEPSEHLPLGVRVRHQRQAELAWDRRPQLLGRSVDATPEPEAASQDQAELGVTARVALFAVRCPALIVAHGLSPDAGRRADRDRCVPAGTRGLVLVGVEDLGRVDEPDLEVVNLLAPREALLDHMRGPDVLPRA